MLTFLRLRQNQTLTTPCTLVTVSSSLLSITKLLERWSTLAVSASSLHKATARPLCPTFSVPPSSGTVLEPPASGDQETALPFSSYLPAAASMPHLSLPHLPPPSLVFLFLPVLSQFVSCPLLNSCLSWDGLDPRWTSFSACPLRVLIILLTV